MKALIIAMLGASVVPAYAEPPATVTINHKGDWKGEDKKPISVRIAGGAWTKVPSGVITKPLELEVGPSGRAIAFEAQVPAGAKPFRRWAAMLPGVSYRMVGNPCALWGLEVDADGSEPERVRIDARNLAANLFPLAISTSDDKDEEPGDSTAILDKPGVSAPIVLDVSAMCPRSGTSVTVRSRSRKKVLFDEQLIPHPHRLHTIRLSKTGFDLVVEPVAP